MQNDATLPTSLWVMAQVRTCSTKSIPVYVAKKGDPDRGTVIAVVDTLVQGFRVFYQARDLEGNLGWLDAFSGRAVDKDEVKGYIDRTIKRDPDIWVIEVEDKTGANPFENNKE